MIKRIATSREFFLFLLFLVLFIIFAVTVEGFLNPYHLLRRTRYWVAAGMIAVPMTFIIATAGIDLSVASIVALCGVVLGMAFNDLGLPLPVAMAAALIAGTLAGGLNGYVGSYIGVPPLVVTLATMVLYRGIAMGLSRARSFGDFPGYFLAFHADALKLVSMPIKRQYIPVSLLVMLGIFFVGWLLMRRSWVGRYTECIGENETAAQFAAIDVRWLKCMLYTVCGLVCGVAALFHTSLYASAKADTATGMELDVIACVVIGGTRISGGQASVIGSLLGLFIIGILTHGLQLAEFESEQIVIVVGALLIVMAVLNEWMARKGEKR